MQRQPWSQSRFKDTFATAENARGYVDKHANWARSAGKVFAERLRKRGLAPKRILEVGSGSGDTAIVLAEAFPAAQVVGVDLSEHMVAIAAERATAAGVAERISFVTGDAARLPCADGEFDVVLSQDTLHLLDDPLPMLEECARVLKPAGRLFVRSVRRSWLGWLDPIFKTGYTAGELADLAVRAKLPEIKVEGSLIYLLLEAARQK